MTLLSLPPELIQAILSFADWSDIISFMATTRYITQFVVSKADVARLRRNCSARLLAWEAEERIERNWPLEPYERRRHWSEYAAAFADHMYLRVIPEKSGDKELEAIPCYTCLRSQLLNMFASNMRSGGRMIGQELASQRICIPCGLGTGFYRGGQRVGDYCVVCEKCAHPLSPWSGARLDRETLEDISESLPIHLDMFTPDDNPLKDDAENFWWWEYSHMCSVCVAEAGYTLKQLLSADPRRDFQVSKMKEKYRRSMFAARKKRQQRGKEIRALLGITDPAISEVMDIEALEIKDDPFPNFQPVPKLSFYSE